MSNLTENFSNLMKEAQKMQEQMQKAQKELQDSSADGESGGGMIKVTINGNNEIVKLEIHPSLMEEDDVEMLQDLLAAAINAANRKLKKISQEKIADLTKGLKIPTDLLQPKDE
jgi:DNA-binding YbaB/EbfC family protein